MIGWYETTTDMREAYIYIYISVIILLSPGTNKQFISRIWDFCYNGIIAASHEMNSEFLEVIKWGNVYFIGILMCVCVCVCCVCSMCLTLWSEIQTEFSYAFLKEHLLIVWPTGKDSTNKVPSDKLYRQTRDCDGAPVGLPSLSPPSGSLDQHLSLPAGAAILTLSSPNFNKEKRFLCICLWKTRHVIP